MRATPCAACMAASYFERSFSMHIAFVSLGAFGHINPTLALVTELVKKLSLIHI